MLKKSNWLLRPYWRQGSTCHTHSSCEVKRAWSKRCYPLTGNGSPILCLSSTLSFSVGFFIQDEATDAQEGTHYHADGIYLLRLLGIKKGIKDLMVLRVRPTPTRLPTNIGQHTLAFYTKCVSPVGARHSWVNAKRVFEAEHSQSHLGIKDTSKQLTAPYYWPKVHKSVH